MCTLIVSVAPTADVPFLVAANRDESLDRPAEPPSRWADAPFVAPRDVLAGGTWLGLTTSGMFVGVTNRFPSDRHAERASRGHLVVSALHAKDVNSLHRQLADVDPQRFNAFHLLYVDAQGHAAVTWSDGEALHQQRLEPGLHVVTERSLGGDDRARTNLIHERWPLLERGPDGLPTVHALEELLSTSNPEDPVGGVCVEVPLWRYGTRSSLVLVARRPPTESRWFWCEGKPAPGRYLEDPALMRALA